MPPFANFHDMLKARVLQARQPIQIIRRSTWDETVPPPAGHSRQDEASRAWNLHVALYYKADGAPWRLPRNPTDLTVCYIGVAFYRNSDNDSLDTSVAQVFNEHGDGVIVRGGPARVSRDDRQPHLNQDDAHALLLHALDTYHREHRTLPARVVLHKTSSFTAGEIEGFQAAADERRLDTLDMSWITSSEGGWLFRPGDAPPLRGTLLTFSDREIVLYTKGSVEFYSTYPGVRPAAHRHPGRPPHPQRPRYRKRDPRAHQDELEPDTARRPLPRHAAHRQPGQGDSAPLTRPSRHATRTTCSGGRRRSRRQAAMPGGRMPHQDASPGAGDELRPTWDLYRRMAALRTSGQRAVTRSCGRSGSLSGGWDRTGWSVTGNLPGTCPPR